MIPESTNGPVREAFHCAIPSAKRVAFCLMGSKVSMEFTAHCVVMNGWSEAFCPTLGRSRTVVMPRALRVAWAPIPEFIRICGLPIAPPERTISFAVWATKRESPMENSC
jgi:hypothetical protein